jgi:hypothetical protein
MTQPELISYQEIENKLAELNQAKINYAQAETRDAKNAADQTFQDCWDWLKQRGIQLHVDKESGFWKLGKEPQG